MKEQNDCYKCPHRQSVPGSAHSRCTILGVGHESAAVGMAMATGKVIQIQDKDSNDLIEFSEHGIRNGWCMWPLNFDPVWLTCRLPIEKQT
jgi:hypothetical protein